jgi:hypothetical protein
MLHTFSHRQNIDFEKRHERRRSVNWQEQENG